MEATRAGDLVYSPAARRFHWWTVALVFIMIPLGIAMTYRGGTLNVWDGLTNNMYSTHKLLGFVLLWLTLGRLFYRLRNGAPADEPTLEWWERAASHATHWGLYALLIVVPVGGWLGVSLYDSRDVFGLFSLPPLASVNQDKSTLVFTMHKLGAVLIALLVLAHIGAALFHHVIRKDGVLRRMVPALNRRD